MVPIASTPTSSANRMVGDDAKVHLESTLSLKTGWRSHGEPVLGRAWDGPWASQKMPSVGEYDPMAANASPTIRTLVEELHLLERVADQLGSKCGGDMAG
jgi:hypothetical protein